LLTIVDSSFLLAPLYPLLPVSGGASLFVGNLVEVPADVIFLPLRLFFPGALVGGDEALLLGDPGSQVDPGGFSDDLIIIEFRHLAPGKPDFRGGEVIEEENGLFRFPSDFSFPCYHFLSPFRF